MIYKNIKKAIFIKKINRFTAIVNIDNSKETVHIKNTGRLSELLIPNAMVILEKSDNLNRKTKYDFVSVYSNGNLVNIDSQILNSVAFNSIKNNHIIENTSNLRKEVKYENSRFDLYFEKEDSKCFMEVKGVNLVKNNIALFPDAPTERGAKHIEELIKATSEGYETFLLFLVSLDFVEKFNINKEMDLNFYNKVIKAKEHGVNILAYNLKVTENNISLNKKIELLF